MSGAKGLEASLGGVGRVLRDGIRFYRRANAVAADPRVKLLFEKLARHRDEGLRAFEVAIAAAGTRVPMGEGHTPYPFEAVAKVECYVCGHSAEDIPATCPQCGAARYAFEKEITRRMAWDIAASTGRTAVAQLEDAIRASTGGLRAALEGLLERERSMLKEAEAGLASATS